MIGIKSIHISLALMSLSGFLLRAYWMWFANPLLQHRVSRFLPHVIDSLLLLTGLYMVWSYRIYPTQHPWLAAKLSALLLYIVFGSLALKRAPTRRWRGVFLLLALATFGYMLGAARSHRAWSWMSWG